MAVAPSLDDVENPRLGNAALTSLERVWRTMVNRRYIILGIVAAAIVLGFLITLTVTPLYTATTRIEISREQDKVADVERVQSDQMVQELTFYQTQYSLLNDRSIAERVVRALRLSTDPQFAQAFDLTSVEGAARGKVADDTAIGILLANVTVKPLRGSSLIDIDFESPDAKLSAKIVNEWVNQFIRAKMDRRFGATADARNFLEQRLEQLRTNLEKSERELIEYAKSQGIVSLDRVRDGATNTTTERTLVASDLEAANVALAAARADRIAAEAQMRRNSNAAAVLNPTLQNLRQRRAELAANVANLEALFGSAYPPLLASRSELANIDRSIASETGRAKSTVSEAYNGALDRERLSEAQFARLKSAYGDQQSGSVRYAILSRDADTNRQLYQSLLQRYKEIGVAGVGANDVAVVHRAMPPTSRSSPRLALNLALAALLGLLLAAAVVFLLEQIDQSVRDPAEVENKLQLPLIGSIPTTQGNLLEDVFDKRSETYEAYLSVRSNLGFLTAHGAPRSMVITSSRPGEGKSTTSVMLSHMFAEQGRSTVLVDGDMRNSSLAKYLGFERHEGLSSYLAGEGELDKLLVKPDRYAFTLMPAGRVPPNAAELLDTDRFDKLIADLLTRFDQVIVDAPPLLGLADTPLIARKVEGAVFVIEANRGKLRIIRTALRRLQMAGAKVFGAIVTKLDDRNASYGSGYGYGYGYGYGDRKGAPTDAAK